MHRNELPIDEHLVRRLVSDQFPVWSFLPLRRLESSGTVHAIYALGNELSVRLPLLREYASDVTREWNWLSFFSPRLPLAIPKPVALGDPSDEYPLNWLVVKWIEGENATESTICSLDTAAESLGRFVVALRQTPTNGERLNQYRGEPLRLRDSLTRQAISQVTDEYESSILLHTWEASLKPDDWDREPQFFHGDLHSGNLISAKGQLSAVIDFGALGTGDPAVDGIPGWWLFTGSSRERFHQAGRFDASMWIRARGWALTIALIALPYYRKTNPKFADMARHAIDEVLADKSETGMLNQNRS